MTCRLRGNGHGKSTLTCFLRKYPKVHQNIQTLGYIKSIGVLRDTARAPQPPTGHRISLHGLAQIDQKCQFWAKFGCFWAKNPLYSPRAESARAVTGRRNSYSARGEDFLTGQLDFFTETAVTPDRKVEKSFPRWEINRHVEG